MTVHPSDLVLTRSPPSRPWLHVRSRAEVLGVRTPTYDVFERRHSAITGLFTILMAPMFSRMQTYIRNDRIKRAPNVYADRDSKSCLKKQASGQATLGR